MPCNRLRSRARSRIRRRSSNPPPWRRSRRQNPPIGRICQRASSSPDCSPTPRSRASSTPAKLTALHLSGSFLVNESFDTVSAAPDDAEKAVRFRRGYYLGDGTGAGKGRQVAGVVLDNWLKGRRKALWISKSDKLCRGRAARLGGARPGEAADRSAVALQAGRADQALRRHPLYDLFDPALGRTPGP